MKRTAALLVLLAILAGVGARIMVMPLQDAVQGHLGYSRTAIHVVPYVENTYLVAVAGLAMKAGLPFGPALLASVASFAAHERILFWQFFSDKQRSELKGSVWYHVQFWTLGPASLFLGAAGFLGFRQRGHGLVGFFLWILWHSLWNRYWLS